MATAASSTGWVLLFYHLADQGMISPWVRVETGDPLGHPSCQGGRATGKHVHVARKYNGEWLPADGPVPFTLGGWLVVADARNYYGSLVRGSEVVTSDSSGAQGVDDLEVRGAPVSSRRAWCGPGPDGLRIAGASMRLLDEAPTDPDQGVSRGPDGEGCAFHESAVLEEVLAVEGHEEVRRSLPRRGEHGRIAGMVGQVSGETQMRLHPAPRQCRTRTRSRSTATRGTAAGALRFERGVELIQHVPRLRRSEMAPDSPRRRSILAPPSSDQIPENNALVSRKILGLALVAVTFFAERAQHAFEGPTLLGQRARHPVGQRIHL